MQHYFPQMLLCDSLDVTPSDYHLFLNLKRCLRGQCFNSNAAVEAWVNTYFTKLNGGIYYRGTHKLVTPQPQLVRNLRILRKFLFSGSEIEKVTSGHTSKFQKKEIVRGIQIQQVQGMVEDCYTFLSQKLGNFNCSV